MERRTKIFPTVKELNTLVPTDLAWIPALPLAKCRIWANSLSLSFLVGNGDDNKTYLIGLLQRSKQINLCQCLTHRKIPINGKCGKQAARERSSTTSHTSITSLIQKSHYPECSGLAPTRADRPKPQQSRAISPGKAFPWIPPQ